jgi:Uma2 family endonuclease
MELVDKAQDVIEAPLSREELAVRYRELCDDIRFSNLPGKIEIDVWGRLVMSPASNYHGTLQTRLAKRLEALGGQAQVEASVLTPAGVLVADVAWKSADFVQQHAFQTPYDQAPDVCVEVTSPSNSAKELQEKVAAYLAAGAHEVWLVYPRSKRFQFYGKQGLIHRSDYVVDLAGFFDET